MSKEKIKEPAVASVSAPPAMPRFRVSANPPTPLKSSVLDVEAADADRAKQKFFEANNIPVGGSIAGVIDVVEL